MYKIIIIHYHFCKCNDYMTSIKPIIYLYIALERLYIRNISLQFSEDAMVLHNVEPTTCIIALASHCKLSHTYVIFSWHFLHCNHNRHFWRGGGGGCYYISCKFKVWLSFLLTKCSTCKTFVPSNIRHHDHWCIKTTWKLRYYHNILSSGYGPRPSGLSLLARGSAVFVAHLT